jgi:hypothetical protein
MVGNNKHSDYFTHIFKKADKKIKSRVSEFFHLFINSVLFLEKILPTNISDIASCQKFLASEKSCHILSRQRI